MSRLEELNLKKKQKLKELVALQQQRNRTGDADEILRLNNKIKALEDEIERIRAEIGRLQNDGQFVDPVYIREDLLNQWDSHHHLIDFKIYFEEFEEVIKRSKKEKHCGTLYLLPSVTISCGDLFIYRVEQLLRHEALYVNPIKREFDFDASSESILNELCADVGVSTTLPSDIKQQEVIAKMKRRFRNNHTIFLLFEIKGRIKQEVLTWFLKFWNDLIMDLPNIASAQPHVRVIAFVTGSQLDDECKQESVCAKTDDIVHKVFQLLEMPMWKKDDISGWLEEYTSLISYGYPIENIRRIADTVVNYNPANAERIRYLNAKYSKAVEEIVNNLGE